MPKLLFTNKNFEEQVYELVVERTTVGRGQQNHLVICDNSVSMNHCEIHMNGSEIIVRDLDSSNGTFVDGARLKNSQSQVRNGQTIRFGLVEAKLQMDFPHDNDRENITAVIDLAQFQAEQRRELKKQKIDFHGKVEPSASVQSESQTVLLPRPQASFSPTGETEPPAEKHSLKAVVIIGVAILAAIALIVFMWSR